eukprot:g5509.t1
MGRDEPPPPQSRAVAPEVRKKPIRPSKPLKPGPNSNQNTSNGHSSPPEKKGEESQKQNNQSQTVTKKRRKHHFSLVPCREAMDLCPVTFAPCFRYTHSDVQKATNTISIVVPRDSIAVGETTGVLPVNRQPAMTPSNMKKHYALIREQRRFMEHIESERTERFEFETWAATAIQAVFRGSRKRPRNPILVDQRERLMEERRLQRKEDARLEKWEVKDFLRDSIRRAEEMHAPVDEEFENIRNLPHNEWQIEQAKEIRRKKQSDLRRKARKEGAIRAQAICRGYLVRRGCRVLRTLHYDEELASAAQTIQTQARSMHKAKRKRLTRIRNNNKFSLVIQRVWRGCKARRWVSLVKKIYLERVESNSAAVLVQSRIRRHLAGIRADKAKTLHATVKVQSQFRGYKDRRAIWQKEEDKKNNAAAVMLQKGGRGLLARKRVEEVKQRKEKEEKENAAIKIQSKERSKQATKKVAEKRKKVQAEKAAKRVQEKIKAEKKEKERRRKEKEKEAATKIQARTRGAQGRKEVKVKKKEKEAAITIQTVQRGKVARAEVERIRLEKNKELTQALENEERMMPVMKTGKK